MFAFELGEVFLAGLAVYVDDGEAVGGAGEADVVVAVAPPAVDGVGVGGGEGLVVGPGFERGPLFPLFEGDEQEAMVGRVGEGGAVAG